VIATWKVARLKQATRYFTVAVGVSALVSGLLVVALVVDS
jgi:hypothetical protein